VAFVPGFLDQRRIISTLSFVLRGSVSFKERRAERKREDVSWGRWMERHISAPLCVG
jgi:hypothetical protein